MNDAELKATMARLEAEEAAGIKCPCFKCHLVNSRIYPALGEKKPKKKREPKPKKQTDADLHAEHGS